MKFEADFNTEALLIKVNAAQNEEMDHLKLPGVSLEHTARSCLALGARMERDALLDRAREQGRLPPKPEPETSPDRFEQMLQAHGGAQKIMQCALAGNRAPLDNVIAAARAEIALRGKR